MDGNEDDGTLTDLTIEQFDEEVDDVAVSQQPGAGVIAAHRAHQYHNLQHPVVVSGTCTQGICLRCGCHISTQSIYLNSDLYMYIRYL